MAELDSMMTLSRTLPAVPFLVRPELALRAEQGLGIGKLQISGANPDVSFLRIVGFDAPPAREQTTAQRVTFAWLAPNEWLLTGAESEVLSMLAQIDERGGDDAFAVDITHARVSMVLSGAKAREALAAHCPLDLWPASFPVHAVARSLLGDAGMFIARLHDMTDGMSDGAQFRIIVDQTMEAYAARILAGPQSQSGTQA